MNDTISRQAAIRWVKTECNPYGNQTIDFESGKKVIEHLERMPSAKPEIIRCKDCDWWTKQDDRIQGRCALMGVYPAGGWFCGNARRKTDG